MLLQQLDPRPIERLVLEPEVGCEIVTVQTRLGQTFLLADDSMRDIVADL